MLKDSSRGPRYALGSEVQFRQLIAELTQRFGTGPLPLMFKNAAPSTFRLHPDHFSFEDHQDDRQVECRVCETVRDRRFALYVTCTDGMVRGPIGSSCLFVHVLSRAESQDLARRLEVIARDAVHFAEHHRLQGQHRSHPLYLQALRLDWCLHADALAGSGLSVPMQTRLAQWQRAPLGPLPRLLFEALRSCHTRGAAVLDRPARRPPPAPTPAGNTTAGLDRPHVRPRRANTESLPPEHLAAITRYWPMIVPHFTTNRRAGLQSDLISGRIRTEDADAVVAAIRRAQAELEPLEHFLARFSVDVLRPWWPDGKLSQLVPDPNISDLHDRLIRNRLLRRSLQRAIDMAISDALAAGQSDALADRALLGPAGPIDPMQRVTLKVMLSMDLGTVFYERYRRPLRWQLEQADVSSSVRHFLIDVHREWRATMSTARPNKVRTIFFAALDTWAAVQGMPTDNHEIKGALWQAHRTAFLQSALLTPGMLKTPRSEAAV